MYGVSLEWGLYFLLVGWWCNRNRNRNRNRERKRKEEEEEEEEEDEMRLAHTTLNV